MSLQKIISKSGEIRIIWKSNYMYMYFIEKLHSYIFWIIKTMWIITCIYNKNNYLYNSTEEVPDTSPWSYWNNFEKLNFKRFQHFQLGLFLWILNDILVTTDRICLGNFSLSSPWTLVLLYSPVVNRGVSVWWHKGQERARQKRTQNTCRSTFSKMEQAVYKILLSHVKK